MMTPNGPFGRGYDDEGGGMSDGRLIGALDVGSSKVACLIGREDEAQEVSLLGVGGQRPQTGPDGAPQNFEACVRAIKIAVDHAERMAGETITSVVTAYGGAGLKTRRLSAAVPLPPGPIEPKSVRMALAATRRMVEPSNAVTLHAIPMGYRVDGGPLVDDPRGFEGRSLTAELIIVTAPEPAVAALTDCINEAGLRVARVVAAPYAAGLAVLSPEERDMGATVLDCGAGHVGVAAFQGGGLILAGHSATGGSALTQDIASAIGTSFAAAERLKLVQGGFGKDRPEQFEAARFGPEGRLEAMLMSRSSLIEAFGPKLELMLTQAGARLESVVRLEDERPWRCAVTGGASLMPGMKELAQTLLRRPARLGRPVGFGVLDDSAVSPAYAVAAGLLRYEVENAPEAHIETERAERIARPEPALARLRPPPEFGDKLNKAWGWFKDNF
jgi:cell division protein FtsA